MSLGHHVSRDPVKTIPELISAARASPGKYNFGSAGTGGLGHLAQELFRLETNVNITHVPYLPKERGRS